MAKKYNKSGFRIPPSVQNLRNSFDMNELRPFFIKVAQNSIYTMEQPKYKPAQLYDCGGQVEKGKEWYFYFYILDPVSGKYKRYFERFNINRIHGKTDEQTRKLRREYAKDIILEINSWLESGQYTESKEIKSPDKTIDATIRLAQDFKANKNLRQRSVQTYKNAGDRFLEFLEDSDKSKTPISKVDRLFIIRYRDWLLKKGTLTNYTINNYMMFLKSLFFELTERSYIEKNPCVGIKKLPETIGTKNIPFSGEELTKIAMLLPDRHPRLWLFMLFIYYCYMRESEIAQLQRGMIDLTNGYIHLPATVGKTRITRVIKILPEFAKYLIQFEVDQLPSHMYLFSKRGTLEPGEKAIVRNRVSELWKKSVKDGMDIKKDMYAAKHTSAKMYVLSGGVPAGLQPQMGHRSIATTEAYLKSILPMESLVRFAKDFPTGILSLAERGITAQPGAESAV